MHYECTSGVLAFQTGEKQKEICIPLINGESDKHFQIFLFNSQVASLNKRQCSCNVYFVQDRKIGILMRMVQSIVRRQDTVLSASNSWVQQFQDAIVPGGAVSLGDGQAQELTGVDYLLHYVSISWKVRVPVDRQGLVSTPGILQSIEQTAVHTGNLCNGASFRISRRISCVCHLNHLHRCRDIRCGRVGRHLWMCDRPV
jgi:hypothetical protein